MASQRPLQPPPVTESGWGIILAIVIVAAWGGSLALLLPVPLSTLPIGGLLVAIGARTFLHTGLFILAHDAMHRNLLPHHHPLNHGIGRLCVGLYAFLSYDQCRRNHGQHHRIPGQIGDPDFHNGVQSHPIAWYWHFLRGYLSLRGFGRFTLGWSGILLGGWGWGGWAIANILLFWALPLILSSMQLFVFGTYRPHRHGLTNPSPAPSSPGTLRIAWSLLSCYHFGDYHWEHHHDPKTPWYRLPAFNPTHPKS
jgi:beta-carotene/zeaxanthin 4-ketolase